MNSFEAVRFGFRLGRRYPRIGVIETLWRTVFMILVILFVFLGTAFFLKNVSVSNLEVQALRSKVPLLVSLTLERLFVRHGGELWHMTLFVVSLSGIMWLLFASLFRAGILGMLFQAYKNDQTAGAQTDVEGCFGESVRRYAGGIGKVNLTYLLFSALVVFLSGGVFWAAVKLGALSGDTFGPLVAVGSVTLGLTGMFIIWGMIDLVTDMAQIAVVFEDLSLFLSLRRTAEVIQRRIGAVIGIGLIYFVLRIIIGVILGVINLAANFVLRAIWPPLTIPATVVLGFLQSVTIYYLYVMNLASYATLYEAQTSVAPTPLPVAERIIYEH